MLYYRTVIRNIFYFAFMTFEQITMTVFALMFALGAIDYLLGTPWNIGNKIVEGLQAFAPLFLTMGGFLVMLPVITEFLTPFAIPFFKGIGADPGLFPGIILASDSGAYPLAQSIASTPDAAGLGGMLLGSMMGANVICMPLILRMLDKNDHMCFFKGLMFAVITMPLGLLAGGLAAGYKLVFIMQQMPLLLIVSFAAAVMLYRIPQILAKILTVFSKAMECVALSGLVIAVLFRALNIKAVMLAPLENAITIIGMIAVILPGVYVFTEVLSRVINKLLPVSGNDSKLNNISLVGFISTAANAIPTLVMIKKMDERGKLLNCAFLGSGAYVLGDHLAYCTVAEPKLIVPLLIAKLTAASSAVFLAWLCLKYSKQQQ